MPKVSFVHFYTTDILQNMKITQEISARNGLGFCELNLAETKASTPRTANTHLGVSMFVFHILLNWYNKTEITWEILECANVIIEIKWPPPTPALQLATRQNAMQLEANKVTFYYNLFRPASISL